MRPKVVTMWHTNDELVVDVRAVCWRGRQCRGRDYQLREELAVELCVLESLASPGIQMAKLHAQDRSVQSIQTAVRAEDFVLVFLAAAMCSEEPKLVLHFGVVQRDHSAITGTAEIF